MLVLVFVEIRLVTVVVAPEISATEREPALRDPEMDAFRVTERSPEEMERPLVIERLFKASIFWL